MSFFLASMSPRRRDLVSQLGIPFQLLNVAIDEKKREQETPINYVERMAKEKVEAGFASLASSDSSLVLAADTIVVLEDRVLGKPENQQQAQSMLRSLSGRSHVVMTAFALKNHEKIRIQRVHTTVFFRNVLESEVQWYWKTGEQLDKAGGYAIQGLGSIFVSTITGSYSSAVGLPMSELVTALRDFGLDFTRMDKAETRQG